MEVFSRVTAAGSMFQSFIPGASEMSQALQKVQVIPGAGSKGNDVVELKAGTVGGVRGSGQDRQPGEEERRAFQSAGEIGRTAASGFVEAGQTGGQGGGRTAGNLSSHHQGGGGRGGANPQGIGFVEALEVLAVIFLRLDILAEVVSEAGGLGMDHLVEDHWVT